MNAVVGLKYTYRSRLLSDLSQGLDQIVGFHTYHFEISGIRTHVPE